MNRDMEDKMRIMQVKSIEAAEKIRSILRIFGILHLAVAIYYGLKILKGRSEYNTDINNEITLRCMVIIVIGLVICVVYCCLADYLYYNLAVKAYTLEFVYNNSCCISDVNNTVTSFNNNMIEGMNIVHANQNKMVSQNEKHDKI